MAAVIERYLGVSITHSGGVADGTITDIQASWNTPAQLWINELDDITKAFVYFAETQGTVAFFDWSPDPASVSIKVVDLFLTAYALTITQKAVAIITIPGCYALGVGAAGAATLNVKAIGGRLIYIGGRYYTILYSA